MTNLSASMFGTVLIVEIHSRRLTTPSGIAPVLIESMPIVNGGELLTLIPSTKTARRVICREIVIYMAYSIARPVSDGEGLRSSPKTPNFRDERKDQKGYL